MYSETKNCKDCKQELKGRNDKKFCNDYCRSNYHTKLNRNSNNIVRNFDNALKRNRRILEELFRNGKNTMPLTQLENMGYKTNFFTHWEENNDLKFCYDFVIKKKNSELYFWKL